MLKGEVFGRQLFENQIFALFINTFLNGNNGVCDNYLNGMAVTYSGSNVTVDSGAVCIQGRFLEEDISTTLNAGTNNLFCKLIIEIDLDKINTDDSFNQAYYKIVSDSTGYPELTQTDIVGTNSGIYQYEFAKFRTTVSGITDFQDTRTFLDFDSIYEEIRKHIQAIDDESIFVLKSQMAYSSSETDTGKVWIDGKKIYRRVYTFQNLHVGANQMSIFIQNFETITNMRGTGVLINGDWIPLVKAQHYTFSYQCGLYYSNEYGIMIEVGSDFKDNATIKKAYIIFEYTKKS